MAHHDHIPTVTPMRVLIVEDEALISLDLEMMVEDFGHDVCGIAICCDSAIRAARVLRPDLVFMDLHLAHGSSGIEAATAIRRDLGISCVLISASLRELEPHHLSAIRPAAMVEKPFSHSELASVLQTTSISLAAPHGAYQ
jgi:two-component system, response regulator PdtaR